MSHAPSPSTPPIPPTQTRLASWIGMMPATVLYVSLGSLAGAGADGRTRTSAEWTLYAVGLAATVAVTLILTRLARRALNQRLLPAG